MLRFNALEIAAALHDLAILETGLAALIHRDGSAASVDQITLRAAMLDAQNAALVTEPYPGMRAATEQARRLADRLARPSRKLSAGEMELEARNLRDVIIAELRRETAISVPRQYVSFVNNDELFGPRVAEAFPSATADLRAAGNCLAVGLHTAAVFHLIRAAEIALRALARERKIPFPKSGIDYATWEQLIRALEAGVDRDFRQWGMGPEKSAAMEFYRSAIASLHAFKEVFRNHVMHSRASYGPEEAVAAMEDVRGFLLGLATRLDESGNRIRWPRPRKATARSARQKPT